MKIILLLILLLSAVSFSTDWPQFYYDSSHAGVSPDTSVNMNSVWSYSSAYNLVGGIAVVNGVIYTSDANGRLVAINDSTGANIYNVTICSGQTPGILAIHGTLVYIPCNNVMYARNTADGSANWSATMPSSYPSYATTYDSGLIIIDDTPYVTAMNATTGAILWNFTGINAPYGSPSVWNGYVGVPYTNWPTAGYYYSLNKTTGAQICNETFPFSLDAVAMGNGVYYARSENVYNLTFAINVSNCVQLWNSTLPASSLAAEGFVWNGRVIADADDGTNYFVQEYNATNGNKICNFSIPDDGFQRSSAMSSDGSLFFQHGSLLYEYNMNTCTEVQNISYAPSTHTSGAFSNGSYYIGGSSTLSKFGTPCITPTNNLLINSSTTLCVGTYHINNSDLNGGVIMINANNVVLQGNNTVLIGNGSGMGIYSKNFNNVTIENLNVSSYLVDIVIDNSYNSTIQNNNVLNTTTVQGSLTGGGIITDYHDSSYTVNLTIKNNFVQGDGTGISVSDGQNCIILNNTVKDTDALLDQGTFTIFSIVASMSNYTQFINNTVLNYGGCALVSDYSSDSNISGNHFESSIPVITCGQTIGIDTSLIQIKNTTISNNFINATNRGILLFASGGGPYLEINTSIFNNTIYSGNNAIEIDDARDYPTTLWDVNATVYGNYISDFNSSLPCQQAFYISMAANSSFYNNTVQGCLHPFRFGNVNNVIFYNNLFNYSDTIYDAGSPKNWTNLSLNTTRTLGTNIIGGNYTGGNFWRGYSGSDINGDGIGEAPPNFSIDFGGGNYFYDYLPLTNNNVTTLSVSLASPDSEITTPNTTLNFTYWFNSNTGLPAQCNLTINGTNYNISNNVPYLTNNTVQNNMTFVNGTYFWNVTCYDGYTKNTSETRNFTIAPACEDRDGDGYNASYNGNATGCGPIDCNDNNASIIPPVAGQAITSNTTFCSGTYDISYDSIAIDIQNGATLTCNNTVLTGNSSSYILLGSGTVLQNCNITSLGSILLFNNTILRNNYLLGFQGNQVVYLIDNKNNITVQNNTIKDSAAIIGIRLYNNTNYDKIVGNTIINTPNSQCTASDYNNFTGNIFQNSSLVLTNDYGSSIGGCEFNLIENNTFRNVSPSSGYSASNQYINYSGTLFDGGTSSVIVINTDIFANNLQCDLTNTESSLGNCPFIDGTGNISVVLNDLTPLSFGTNTTILINATFRSCSDVDTFWNDALGPGSAPPCYAACVLYTPNGPGNNYTLNQSCYNATFNVSHGLTYPPYIRYGIIPTYALEVDDGNNSIYNNFFNSTYNAIDTNGSNDWNTTKTAGTNIIGGRYIGGNFWSDYNGTDSDNDGIGDTQYNGTTFVDYLPLVPYTAPITPGGGGGSTTTTKVTLTETFNCSTGELDVSATSSSAAVPGLNIKVFTAGTNLQEQTDSGGMAVFSIANNGAYDIYSDATGSYLPASLDPAEFDLCNVPPANNTPVVPPQNQTITPPVNPNPTPQNQSPAPAGPSQGDAQSAISSANSAIGSADAAGKDTTAAKAKLADANAALAAGNFALAQQLAGEALQLALNAQPLAVNQPPASNQTTSPPPSQAKSNSMWWIIGLVAVVVLVAGAWYFTRKKPKYS